MERPREWQILVDMQYKPLLFTQFTPSLTGKQTWRLTDGLEQATLKSDQNTRCFWGRCGSGRALHESYVLG